MRERKIALLLTCEHASKAVPAELKSLFRGQQKLLATHRGWDIGALDLSKYLMAHQPARLFCGKYSRLVVDLNRSISNETLFSELTWKLTAAERKSLIQKYHAPHWDQVHRFVTERIKKNERVFHLGIHSFTPELHGEIRNCEIGLLFDPKKTREAQLCQTWQRQLQKQKTFRVRLNYPYTGTGDSLTVHLRKKFGSVNYLGIELEINQKCLLDKKMKPQIHSLVQNTFAQITQFAATL